MGRFRKRKPAVAWLPHVQHDAQDSAVGVWDFATTVSAVNNGFNTSIFSLVPDFPGESIRASGTIASLADFEGSAYRLRRIVGKIFLGMQNNLPTAPDTRPIAALCGAGFIVLRVDPQTGAPLVATANSYSPLINDSTRDPWIWRRTWLLQNDFSGNVQDTQDTWQFPRTNCDYGSAVDGPHIDARTARIVADEERLFCIVSTQNISGDSTIGGAIRGLLDYRILATPVRRTGNRRNASR